MLGPRHLIFTAVEGALVDSRTGSFAEAEEALSEIHRRQIPFILLTARTRAEIEPLRRKLGHTHPFVTEDGGGIFFPDGYFNLRIPDAKRAGRYLSVALGLPYKEVCDALDELAEECQVGVTGFHHMSPREIAQNTGLQPRNAKLAAAREFDEPFFLTSGDGKASSRLAGAAKQRGFDVFPGHPFWHICSGCDPAKAVRTLTKLFREALHFRLRTMGLGVRTRDLSWLRVMDHAVLLPSRDMAERDAEAAQLGRIARGEAAGPAGWNEAVLNFIG